MKIALLVPCYNEEKYIENFLNDLNSLDLKGFETDLYLIDGMSSDNTIQIVNNFKSNFFNIHVVKNEKRFVSDGLNLALNKVKCDIIVRLDVHASYPTNYLQILIPKLLDKEEIKNVGCLVRTLPGDETNVAYVISKLLSSKIGVGNSKFRTGVEADQYVDTVPFGCFKSDIFGKIGIFDTELIRNQDDEFNARILKNGFKVLLTPDVVVDYFPRSSVGKVRQMFYQYGLFKPLVNKKIGSVTTLRQLAPLFVVLFFLATILASLVLNNFFLILIVPVAYMFVSFLFSLLVINNIQLIILVFIVLINIHFSYGFGYLLGLARVFLFPDNKNNISSSR